MKYYISEIIPKLQKLSRKLDELSLIQNYHWIAFNDIVDTKTTYIFRDNKDLIISEGGLVTKGKWDYLGNQTIFIENQDEKLLFRNSFFDETVLVLNLHNTDTYAFFLNETKLEKSIKSIEELNDFLIKKHSISNYQNKFVQRNFKTVEAIPNEILTNSNTLKTRTISYLFFCVILFILLYLSSFISIFFE